MVGLAAVEMEEEKEEARRREASDTCRFLTEPAGVPTAAEIVALNTLSQDAWSAR